MRIFKKITKLLLIISIFALSLNAIEENKIKEDMTIKINDIIKNLKNKELKKEEKEFNIYKIIDEVFDYRIMSRISLGKQWKTLNSEQKNTFIIAFEKKLKLSYIDKLNLYTDEKIIIKEIKKSSKKRIQLFTDLVGKTESFEIIYKFHKNKKNDWLIYDINIIGVSIMQTYRKQFSSYLKSNTFDSLVNTL